jgi:hypothetical protein
MERRAAPCRRRHGEPPLAPRWAPGIARATPGGQPWSNEGMAPGGDPEPGRAPHLAGHRAGHRASRDAREEPAWLERVRRGARLDLRPGAPPSNLRWTLATVVSVALSLCANAVSVHVAKTELPSLRHFSQFRVDDYGTLTVVGALAGAAGWAALVRLSSAARWLFLRLAVAVTLVLWLPDVWILVQGATAKGVATLVGMHLLVVLVTYNVLVRVAPARARLPQADVAAADRRAPIQLPDAAVRRIWNTMGLLVALELVLGVVVIVSVPFRRPAGLLPARGTWVYAAHGAVGIVLGIGALAVLVLSTVAGRMGRIGAVLGAGGVGVGLVGGVLASFQTTRLLGMVVMLVGVIVAGVGYMCPSLEAIGKSEMARAEAARAHLAAQGEARAGAVHPEADLAPSDRVTSNGHGATPRAG